MEFLDRINETRTLRETLQRERSALVVVYGRRRVGKSTLIKQVLQDDDVYHLSEEAQMQQQLDSFAKTVALRYEGFDRVRYYDWESVLLEVNRHIAGKITVCLDEFPYLVRTCASLPSIIQRLVDNGALRYNLILCGSSQRMMHGLVLNEKSPLYQRTDWQPRIRQLRLPYLQKALNCSAAEAVEEYAVWGGVPRYWALRTDFKSLTQAIQRMLIDSNGILFEEPLRLLRDERRETAMSSSILSIIGNGANRISEIAARVQQPATNLSLPLSVLMEMDYVEREVPFGENPKNSKRGLYRLADNFLAFYYKFVQPNKNLISLDRTDVVMGLIKKEFPAHVGQTWEKLCRDFVSGNTIDGITYGPAARWWGNLPKPEGGYEQAEIDVVAESLDGKHLLVGECKWRANKGSADAAADLESRAERLPLKKPKQTVHKYLFLKTKPTEPMSMPCFDPNDIVRSILEQDERRNALE